MTKASGPRKFGPAKAVVCSTHLLVDVSLRTSLTQACGCKSQRAVKQETHFSH